MQLIKKKMKKKTSIIIFFKYYIKLNFQNFLKNHFVAFTHTFNV